LIRDASIEDAVKITQLIEALGFSAAPEEVAVRIQQFGRSGHPVLVADEDGPVGCLTWHLMPVLHRATAVGRISMLIVDEAARGRGIGTALVREAERKLALAGCGLVEVTSNERLQSAHAFYERLGYARTSLRFARNLAFAS
jgi:ribosomal protein S18 acetylase RimI-like enzyme